MASFAVLVLVALPQLNQSPAEANGAPVPLIYLDATNPASYSGTGLQWNDVSGNNRHGTVYPGIGTTQVSYNSVSKAFEFPGGGNGSGGYVQLAGQMDDFGSGFTLEFEGEFGATKANWERIFDFAAGVGSTNDALWVGQFDNFNELALEIFEAGVSKGYCYTATNQTALGANRSFNKWLVTIDNSSPFKCRIYKNGVELPTRVSSYASRNLSPTGANTAGSDYALPPNTPRGSNFLGRSNFTADRDFEGSIRYIRLYDQTLTPTQALENATATVTFDPNGGSGTMAAQSSTTEAALNSNSFRRTGRTFLGWNTAQGGGGQTYIDGANFPFSSNTTLYAQWSAGSDSEDGGSSEQSIQPSPRPQEQPTLRPSPRLAPVTDRLESVRERILRWDPSQLRLGPPSGSSDDDRVLAEGESGSLFSRISPANAEHISLTSLAEAVATGRVVNNAAAESLTLLSDGKGAEIPQRDVRVIEAGSLVFFVYPVDDAGEVLEQPVPEEFWVSAGGSLQLVASGLLPNSVIRAWLYSEPRDLGIFNLDLYGEFSGEFDIPADLESGYHTLKIVGPTAAGDIVTVAVEVFVAPTELSASPSPTQASAEPAVVTGDWWWLWLIVVSLALAAALILWLRQTSHRGSR